jgi:hypothetical protein
MCTYSAKWPVNIDRVWDNKPDYGPFQARLENVELDHCTKLYRLVRI